ncbi:hypothetical protein SHI21_08950 [Bacteriovorax sp. PP10]|uniref:Uncharacterized protein n=1 Tax=Bacteriovorax antarcticus TaxID=3088717 RepID=A0ABU5VTF1_9BACT|nr:hypothetical protein [Bacteriovorax sp. PP10]MEA9356328.1 hypothetical protein [Bacteriovorax sp. PP10]
MKFINKNSLIILAMALTTSTSAFAFNFSLNYNRHNTALDAKCTDVSKQYKVKATIKNTYNLEERTERFKLQLSNSKKNLKQSREGGLYAAENGDNDLKLKLHLANKLDQVEPVGVYETTGDAVVTFKDNEGSLKTVNLTCTIKGDDMFYYSSLRESFDVYQFGYNDM